MIHISLVSLLVCSVQPKLGSSTGTTARHDTKSCARQGCTPEFSTRVTAPHQLLETTFTSERWLPTTRSTTTTIARLRKRSRNASSNGTSASYGPTNDKYGSPTKYYRRHATTKYAAKQSSRCDFNAPTYGVSTTTTAANTITRQWYSATRHGTESATIAASSHLNSNDRSGWHVTR